MVIRPGQFSVGFSGDNVSGTIDPVRLGASIWNLATGNNGDGSLSRDHSITKIADAVRDFHFEDGPRGRAGEVRDFMNFANAAGGLDAPIEVPYSITAGQPYIDINILRNDTLPFTGVSRDDMMQSIRLPLTGSPPSITPRQIADAMFGQMRGNAGEFNRMAGVDVVGTAAPTTTSPGVGGGEPARTAPADPTPPAAPTLSDANNAEITYSDSSPLAQAAVGPAVRSLLTGSTVSVNGTSIEPDGDRITASLQLLTSYIEHGTEPADRAQRVDEATRVFNSMTTDPALSGNFVLMSRNADYQRTQGNPQDLQEMIAAMGQPAVAGNPEAEPPVEAAEATGLVAAMGETGQQAYNRMREFAQAQDRANSGQGGGFNFLQAIMMFFAQFIQDPEDRREFLQSMGIEDGPAATAEQPTQTADAPAPGTASPAVATENIRINQSGLRAFLESNVSGSSNLDDAQLIAAYNQGKAADQRLPADILHDPASLGSGVRQAVDTSITLSPAQMAGLEAAAAATSGGRDDSLIDGIRHDSGASRVLDHEVSRTPAVAAVTLDVGKFRALCAASGMDAGTSVTLETLVQRYEERIGADALSTDGTNITLNQQAVGSMIADVQRNNGSSEQNKLTDDERLNQLLVAAQISAPSGITYNATAGYGSPAPTPNLADSGERVVGGPA